MFPPTSSNIAQTQAHGSLGRRARRAVASAMTAGAATIALLAGASSFASAAENSPRMAQEQYACTVVMGLHRPGDLYDTCLRSLDKSLSELDQARRTSTDRNACARDGFVPNTPGYAVCVEGAERSPTEAAPYRATVSVH
jgi:hypothetical protein